MKWLIHDLHPAVGVIGVLVKGRNVTMYEVLDTDLQVAPGSSNS